MIIRIMGEGQYEMKDEAVDRLNELDRQLEATLNAGDRSKFAEILTQMTLFVEQNGRPLANDSLEPSDAVLPSADTSAEELRALLKEEGLIPGT